MIDRKKVIPVERHVLNTQKIKITCIFLDLVREDAVALCIFSILILLFLDGLSSDTPSFDSTTFEGY